MDEKNKHNGTSKSHTPNGFEDHQKAIANYLGNKFNLMPTILKRIFLLTLGMATIIICLLSILVAVDGGHNARFSIDMITRPKDIRVDRSTLDPLPASPEIQRVRLFKLFLDSLQKDKGGKKKYDSILFHHPGLPDSIDNLLNH